MFVEVLIQILPTEYPFVLSSVADGAVVADRLLRNTVSKGIKTKEFVPTTAGVMTHLKLVFAFVVVVVVAEPEPVVERIFLFVQKTISFFQILLR